MAVKIYNQQFPAMHAHVTLTTPRAAATIMPLLLALLMLALPTSARAQMAWYNVRGTVYDSQSLDRLPGASVQLNDSTGRLVAGRQTAANGQFMLPGVAAGRYTLKVSFVGYKSQSFALDLKGRGGNKKVQDILLREDATLMQEAVVTGLLPEMTVVEDTVVYNAAAFSLPAGAMVEELLKKLPGIVIDDNGKITHNGKEVKQILVDGKEFFNNNQELILKNLPADIVEKVKAYDRKSDLARITGIDDGEEQTVLDLEVKKDKRRGWFGNVDGAYGTHNRYNARVMVNRFLDKQKASVVGNANNTRGNGMTDNQDAAATLNLEWDKLELNGGVTGRFNQRSGTSWSNAQNFENRNAAYSNRFADNGGRNSSFATNWRIEWKPDTMTNILLRPQFSLGAANSHSATKSATFNDDPYAITTDPLATLANDTASQFAELRRIAVNSNHTANRSASDNISGSLSVQVNRRLSKPGRNITLNASGEINSSDGNSSNYSQINYYQLLALSGQDSIYHKIQYDDNSNRGRNISARVSYTEPIAQGYFLQASYQYSMRYQSRDRNVASIFDPMVGTYGLTADNYEGNMPLATPDTAQCNHTQNRYSNHDIRLQLRHVGTKVRFTVGINLRPQHNVVDYTKGWRHYDVARTVFNWAPTLNFRYRFSKQEQLQVRYGGQTGQPSITDLIPDTLSNANPLNIRLGNPALDPSFTHSLRFEYRKSIADLQRSFHLNADFRATQNAVASRTEYNDITGGRTTMPVNINGNWNASANFNFNTAFNADQRFRINTNTRLGHTNAVGYVYQADQQATVKNTTRSTNMNQSVRASFRNDWLDVAINGAAYYNRARASATAASNLDNWGYSYGASLVLNFDFGLNVSTDIGQHSRRGYADAAMNTNQWLWNAQVAQSLLKRRQLTLALRWQDILGQRDMVSRSVTATARTDSDSERVLSYIMLSATYRFNVFGGR